jgi:hypothetical protein
MISTGAEDGEILGYQSYRLFERRKQPSTIRLATECFAATKPKMAGNFHGADLC